MVLPTSYFTPDRVTGLPPDRGTIYDSAFFGNETIRNLRQPDLTNDIHPIFRASNFEKPIADQYHVIETSLRLASRLLERLLPIFHAIYFNTPEALTLPSGERVGTLPDPTYVTEQQKEKARELLVDLADAVKFSYFDGPPHGSAVRLGNETTAKIRGKCTHIRIKRDDLRTIKDLGLGEVNDEYFRHIGEYDGMFPELQDRVRLMFHQWQLAVTLAHEVVHAVTYAAGWWELPGMATIFFDGTDEPGYAAEKFLFGGVISHPLKHTKGRSHYSHADKFKTELEGTITMWDYPCAGVLRVCEDDIPVRVQTPLPSQMWCQWRVRFVEIARLFYDEFWDANPQDLLMTKEAGWRYDEREDIGGGVNFHDLETGVPQGYELDRNGLVIKSPPRPWLRQS